MNQRVGLGYDVHPFGGDRALVLGGVGIEGPGLAGHSDADVVTHAVADALLGAIALGDLGTHFPASDERWRGASSLTLLEQVATMVAGTPWRLANVDVVVAAEQPKLGPHVERMQANLAAAVAPALVPGRDASLPPVTVKPKFGEGVGFVGRGEGIAAWAISLMVVP